MRKRIRVAAAALLVALGCGPRVGQLESGATKREVASDHGSETIETVPVIPEFAKLDLDPKTAFPLRARMRSSGPLYESRTGPVLTSGDGRAVGQEVIVIDADTEGAPRRPQILCVESDHRIAVHMDAASLATVVRSTALVVPKPSVPEQFEETTPGVRLGPGEEVEVLAEKAGELVRLRYSGVFLKTEGWAHANLIGLVYEPAPLNSDKPDDLDLLRDVRLLDAPEGNEVARLENVVLTGDFRAPIHKLGPAKDGFLLVEYTNLNVLAVGWIESTAVRDHEDKDLWGYGLSSDDTKPKRPVTLSPGTLLVSRATGAVLGVVTKQADFPCEAGCKSAEPRVRLEACAEDVSVRAKPPR